MTPGNDDPGAAHSARRKLVRGAFAAPAMLTLYSGGAVAASSSMRCIVTQNARNATQGIGVTGSATDIYQRYQLYEVVSNNNATPTTYYINGADLTPFVRKGLSPFLSPTQAQQFDIAQNLLIGSPISNQMQVPSGYTLRRSQKFIVLRMDVEGRIVSAGAGNSGAAITGSCWTSFMTGTPA